jgi:hypothetical protein
MKEGIQKARTMADGWMFVSALYWREEKVTYDTHLEDEVLVVREIVQEVPGDPTTTMELSQIMAAAGDVEAEGF